MTNPALEHPGPSGASRFVQKKDSANYRPEVEGVRAVASLLVAAFHIWLGRVSGGVDVFFVIAGFLTTVTLLGQIRRFGRVRPGLFLSRLASRLFPASAVVLVVVSAASFVLLLPSQWKQTFTEVVASALYLENWQLVRSGVDYLALDNFHSPVQNFWAMSVQGQFYLIWAALFVAVGLVARRLWKTDARRILIAALAVVTVASFAFSIYSVAKDQPTAYYSTFARAWEFGLGALAAVILPSLRINDTLRLISGWVGLAGLLSCGFVLQVSTQFPGVAALWPTLSAVLILVAGTGAPSARGAERLLASRPLVWLGGISYGLYLWHWPLLVFWEEITGARPGALVGLIIIALAIGLASLSKKYIEDPIHRRVPSSGAGGAVSKHARADQQTVPDASPAEPRRPAEPRPPAEPRRPALVRAALPFAMLALGALVGGLALGGVDYASGQDLRRAHAVAESEGPCVGASALVNAATCPDEWTSSLPALDSSEDGSVIGESRCSTNSSGTELKECVFGVKGSDTRVVLIGNSHAASYFPAVEQMAEERGWELHVFYKNGCVFNTATRRDDSESSRASCTAWNTKLQERLAEQEPYTYAVTSYSAKKSVYTDADGEPSDQAGVEGFRESWAPLLARGTEVLALVDHPVMESIEEGKCAERPGDASTCRIDLEEAFDDRDLIAEAATDWPGAVAIDLRDYYCTDDGCPLVIGGIKVYRDRGHITATYMRTLAPFLTAEAEQALGHRL